MYQKKLHFKRKINYELFCKNFCIQGGEENSNEISEIQDVKTAK